MPQWGNYLTCTHTKVYIVIFDDFHNSPTSKNRDISELWIFSGKSDLSFRKGIGKISESQDNMKS